MTLVIVPHERDPATGTLPTSLLSTQPVLRTARFDHLQGLPGVLASKGAKVDDVPIVGALVELATLRAILSAPLLLAGLDAALLTISPLLRVGCGAAVALDLSLSDVESPRHLLEEYLTVPLRPVDEASTAVNPAVAE